MENRLKILRSKSLQYARTSQEVVLARLVAVEVVVVVELVRAHQTGVDGDRVHHRAEEGHAEGGERLHREAAQHAHHTADAHDRRDVQRGHGKGEPDLVVPNARTGFRDGGGVVVDGVKLGDGGGDLGGQEEDVRQACEPAQHHGSLGVLKMVVVGLVGALVADSLGVDGDHDAHEHCEGYKQQQGVVQPDDAECVVAVVVAVVEVVELGVITGVDQVAQQSAVDTIGHGQNGAHCVVGEDGTQEPRHQCAGGEKPRRVSQAAVQGGMRDRTEDNHLNAQVTETI